MISSIYSLEVIAHGTTVARSRLTWLRSYKFESGLLFYRPDSAPSKDIPFLW